MEEKPLTTNRRWMSRTALLFLLQPAVLFAQADTASVAGRVTDQTGAFVPGATVTLAAKPAGGERTATTDAQGAFEFTDLAAGEYALTVDLPGFGRAAQDLRLEAGQSRQTEVVLKARRMSEDVTITATRTPQEIAAVPGSVTVVSRQTIVDQTVGSKGLGDALGKTVPGLAAPQSSNSQAGQTLRGRTLSVLIDGVPMSTTRNVQRDLESIDPSAIERIEVLRGPTAIYGDGAMGGVMNIITRAPGVGPVQHTTDLDFNSSLTHPSDSFGGRLWQSATGRKGAFDFIVNGSAEHVGGFFDAEGDRTPPDPNNQGGLADSNNLNGFGKFGYTFGRQRVELLASHTYRRQNTDYTTDPAVNTQPGHQKARALAGLDLDEPQGADNTVINLDYRHQRLLSSSLHAQVYYRDYTSTFFPRDFRAVAARGNLIYQSFIESAKTGGRLEMATSFEGPRKPTFLWGLDATSEDTVQPVHVMDPAAFDASRGLVYRIVGRRNWTPPMDQRHLGLFAHGEWKPFSRLLLRAGVRRETIDVDVSDFTVLQGFQIAGGELDYDATPMNAGLVVYPADSFNFFLNYSEGFSIADIGLVLRAAPRNFDVTRLKPEAQTVKNYEGGLRFNRTSVQSTIAVFYNTSDFGVTFAPDFTMVRSPEKIYGVEATLDVQPAATLRLGLTATWLEGKFDADRDGTYAYLPDDRIPAPKLTLYAEHETTPRWRNRVQALYNGERDRFGAQGQPDLIGRIGFGLARIEPFLLVDLFSYLRAGRGTFRIGVQNLLNEMYFPPVSQWSGQDATYAAAQGAVLSLGYTVRY